MITMLLQHCSTINTVTTCYTRLNDIDNNNEQQLAQYLLLFSPVSTAVASSMLNNIVETIVNSISSLNNISCSLNNIVQS